MNHRIVTQITTECCPNWISLNSKFFNQKLCVQKCCKLLSAIGENS